MLTPVKDVAKEPAFAEFATQESTSEVISEVLRVFFKKPEQNQKLSDLVDAHDVVLPRFGLTNTEVGLQIYRALVKWFNDSSAAEEKKRVGGPATQRARKNAIGGQGAGGSLNNHGGSISRVPQQNYTKAATTNSSSTAFKPKLVLAAPRAAGSPGQLSSSSARTTAVGVQQPSSSRINHQNFSKSTSPRLQSAADDLPRRPRTYLGQFLHHQNYQQGGSSSSTSPMVRLHSHGSTGAPASKSTTNSASPMLLEFSSPEFGGRGGRAKLMSRSSEDLARSAAFHDGKNNLHLSIRTPRLGETCKGSSSTATSATHQQNSFLSKSFDGSTPRRTVLSPPFPEAVGPRLHLQQDTGEDQSRINSKMNRVADDVLRASFEKRSPSHADGLPVPVLIPSSLRSSRELSPILPVVRDQLQHDENPVVNEAQDDHHDVPRATSPTPSKISSSTTNGITSGAAVVPGNFDPKPQEQLGRKSSGFFGDDGKQHASPTRRAAPFSTAAAATTTSRPIGAWSSERSVHFNELQPKGQHQDDPPASSLLAPPPPLLVGRSGSSSSTGVSSTRTGQQLQPPHAPPPTARALTPEPSRTFSTSAGTSQKLGLFRRSIPSATVGYTTTGLISAENNQTNPAGSKLIEGLGLSDEIREALSKSLDIYDRHGTKKRRITTGKSQALNADERTSTSKSSRTNHSFAPPDLVESSFTTSRREGRDETAIGVELYDPRTSSSQQGLLSTSAGAAQELPPHASPERPSRSKVREPPKTGALLLHDHHQRVKMMSAGSLQSSPRERLGKRDIKGEDPDDEKRSPGEISLADSCYIVSKYESPGALSLLSEDERVFLEAKQRDQLLPATRLIDTVDWGNFDSNDVIARAFRFRQLQRIHFVKWQRWLWDCWKKEGVAEAFYAKRIGPRRLPRYFRHYLEGIQNEKRHRDEVDDFYTTICLKLLQKYFHKLRRFMQFSQRISAFTETNQLRVQRLCVHRWKRFREEERVRKSYRVLACFYEWRNVFLDKKLEHLRAETSRLDKQVAEKVAVTAKGMRESEIAELFLPDCQISELERQAVSVIQKLLTAPAAVVRLLQGHSSCQLAVFGSSAATSTALGGRSSVRMLNSGTGKIVPSFRGARSQSPSTTTLGVLRRTRSAREMGASAAGQNNYASSFAPVSRSSRILPGGGEPNINAGSLLSPATITEGVPFSPQHGSEHRLLAPIARPGGGTTAASRPPQTSPRDELVADETAKMSSRKVDLVQPRSPRSARGSYRNNNKNARSTKLLQRGLLGNTAPASAFAAAAKSGGKMLLLGNVSGKRILNSARGAATSGGPLVAKSKIVTSAVAKAKTRIRNYRTGGTGVSAGGAAAFGQQVPNNASAGKTNTNAAAQQGTAQHRPRAISSESYSLLQERPRSNSSLIVTSPSRSVSRYQYDVVESEVPRHQRSTASTRVRNYSNDGSISPMRSARSRSGTPRSAAGGGASNSPGRSSRRKKRSRSFSNTAKNGALAVVPDHDVLDYSAAAAHQFCSPTTTSLAGYLSPRLHFEVLDGRSQSTVPTPLTTTEPPPARARSSTALYAAEHLRSNSRSRVTVAEAGSKNDRKRSYSDYGTSVGAAAAYQHREDQAPSFADDDLQHYKCNADFGSNEAEILGFELEEQPKDLSSHLYEQKYLHIAPGLKSASFFQDHPLLSSTLHKCKSTTRTTSSATSVLAPPQNNSVFVPDGGMVLPLIETAAAETWNERCNLAFAFHKTAKLRTSFQRRVLAGSRRAHVCLKTAFTAWKQMGLVLQRIRLVSSQIELQFRKRFFFRIFSRIRIPFCVNQRRKEQLLRERGTTCGQRLALRTFRKFTVLAKKTKLIEEKVQLFSRKLFLSRWFDRSVEQKRLKVLALHCATEIRYRHLQQRTFLLWRGYWAFWRTGVGIALAKASVLRKKRFLLKWAENILELKQRRQKVLLLGKNQDTIAKKKALKGFQLSTFGVFAVKPMKFEEQMWACYCWMRRYCHLYPHHCVPHQIAFKNLYFDAVVVQEKKDSFSTSSENLSVVVPLSSGVVGQHDENHSRSLFSAPALHNKNKRGLVMDHDDRAKIHLVMSTDSWNSDDSVRIGGPKNYGVSPIASLVSGGGGPGPKSSLQGATVTNPNRGARSNSFGQISGSRTAGAAFSGPPPRGAGPAPSSLASGGPRGVRQELHELQHFSTYRGLEQEQSLLPHATNSAKFETARVVKPLINLFTAPFALHPHRFRKSFGMILSLLRCTLLRKMLKAWRRRVQQERVFRLKMRFNCIWDAFVAYRDLCRKRRRIHKVFIGLSARTNFRRMAHGFEKWENKYAGHNLFRRNFGTFRHRKMQTELRRFFHVWRRLIRLEQSVRRGLMDFLNEKKRRLLAICFNTLKQDKQQTQRMLILHDVSDLHWYKKHGTRALAAWRQYHLRSQIVSCFIRLRGRKQLLHCLLYWKIEVETAIQNQLKIERKIAEKERQIVFDFFRQFRFVTKRVRRIRNKRLQREEQERLQLKKKSLRGFRWHAHRENYLNRKEENEIEKWRSFRLKTAFKALAQFTGLCKAMQFFAKTVEKSLLRRHFAEVLHWNREKLLADVRIFSTLLQSKLRKMVLAWKHLSGLSRKVKLFGPRLFHYRLRSCFAHFAFNTWVRIAVRSKRQVVHRKLLAKVLFRWRFGMERERFFTKAGAAVSRSMHRRLACQVLRSWGKAAKESKRHRLIVYAASVRQNAILLTDAFSLWREATTQQKRLERLKLRRQTTQVSQMLHLWYKFTMVQKCIAVSATILRQIKAKNFLQQHLAAWSFVFTKRVLFRENLQSLQLRKRQGLVSKAFYTWTKEKRRKERQKTGVLDLQRKMLKKTLKFGFQHFVKFTKLKLREKTAALKLGMGIQKVLTRNKFRHLRYQCYLQTKAEQKRKNCVEFVQRRILRPAFVLWKTHFNEVLLTEKQTQLADKFRKTKWFRSCHFAWCEYVVRKRRWREKTERAAEYLVTVAKANYVLKWRNWQNSRKRDVQLEKLSFLFDKTRRLKATFQKWHGLKNGPRVLAKMYENKILDRYDNVLQLFDYWKLIQYLFAKHEHVQQEEVQTHDAGAEENDKGDELRAGEQPLHASRSRIIGGAGASTTSSTCVFLEDYYLVGKKRREKMMTNKPSSKQDSSNTTHRNNNSSRGVVEHATNTNEESMLSLIARVRTLSQENLSEPAAGGGRSGFEQSGLHTGGGAAQVTREVSPTSLLVTGRYSPPPLLFSSTQHNRLVAPQDNSSLLIHVDDFSGEQNQNQKENQNALHASCATSSSTRQRERTRSPSRRPRKLLWKPTKRLERAVILFRVFYTMRKLQHMLHAWTRRVKVERNFQRLAAQKNSFRAKSTAVLAWKTAVVRMMKAQLEVRTRRRERVLRHITRTWKTKWFNALDLEKKKQTLVTRTEKSMLSLSLLSWRNLTVKEALLRENFLHYCEKVRPRIHLELYNRRCFVAWEKVTFLSRQLRTGRANHADRKTRLFFQKWEFLLHSKKRGTLLTDVARVEIKQKQLFERWRLAFRLRLVENRVPVSRRVVPFSSDSRNGTASSSFSTVVQGFVKQDSEEKEQEIGRVEQQLSPEDARAAAVESSFFPASSDAATTRGELADETAAQHHRVVASKGKKSRILQQPQHPATASAQQDLPPRHLGGLSLQRTCLQRWHSYILLKQSEHKLVEEYSANRFEVTRRRHFAHWLSTLHLVRKHRRILQMCKTGKMVMHEMDFCTSSSSSSNTHQRNHPATSSSFGTVLKKKFFALWFAELSFKQLCTECEKKIQTVQKLQTLKKWRSFSKTKKRRSSAAKHLVDRYRTRVTGKHLRAMRRLYSATHKRKRYLLQKVWKILHTNAKNRMATLFFLRAKLKTWKSHVQYVKKILSGAGVIALRRIQRAKKAAFAGFLEDFDERRRQNQRARVFRLSGTRTPSRCFLLWRRHCFGLRFAKLLGEKMDSQLQATYERAFTFGLLKDFRELQAKADQMLAGGGAGEANQAEQQAQTGNFYRDVRTGILDIRGGGGPTTARQTATTGAHESRIHQQVHLTATSSSSSCTSAPVVNLVSGGGTTTSKPRNIGDPSLVSAQHPDWSKDTTAGPADSKFVTDEELSSVTGAEDEALHDVGPNAAPHDHLHIGSSTARIATGFTSQHNSRGPATSAKTSKAGPTVVQLLDSNLVNFRPRILTEYVHRWVEVAQYKQNLKKSQQLFRQKQLETHFRAWRSSCLDEQNNRVARRFFLKKSLREFREATEEILDAKVQLNLKLAARTLRAWKIHTVENAKQRALFFRADRFFRRRVFQKFFRDCWLHRYHAPQMKLLKRQVPAWMKDTVAKRVQAEVFSHWRDEASTYGPILRQFCLSNTFRRWRTWGRKSKARREAYVTKSRTQRLQSCFAAWFLQSPLATRLRNVVAAWKMLTHEQGLLRLTRGDTTKLRTLYDESPRKVRRAAGRTRTDAGGWGGAASSSSTTEGVSSGRAAGARGVQVGESRILSSGITARAGASGSTSQMRARSGRAVDRERPLDRSVQNLFSSSREDFSITSSLDSLSQSLLRDSADHLFSPKALRKSRILAEERREALAQSVSLSSDSGILLAGVDHQQEPSSMGSQTGSRLGKATAVPPTSLGAGPTTGSWIHGGPTSSVVREASAPVRLGQGLQLPKFPGFPLQKICAPTLGPLPANPFGGGGGGGGFHS
ncbi:unnamed protein product [Amoebophrya sp. A120]|nr:unnamed protein product [Amoebophrya sp. A120]|eukprot:GSA120T00018136001.1